MQTDTTKINLNIEGLSKINSFETNSCAIILNSNPLTPSSHYVNLEFSPENKINRSEDTQSTLLKSSLNSTPQKDIYSDRFIPWRIETISRKLFGLPEEGNFIESEEVFNDKDQNSIKYKQLLEDEVLGIKNIETSPVKIRKISFTEESDKFSPLNKPKLLHFKCTMKNFKRFDGINTTNILPFALDSYNCPISKNIRKIPDKPYKILEAPNLEDDFYLNLIDWSNSNILGVALQSSIYLWSPFNSSVHKLCQTNLPDVVYSSIAWDSRGCLVACGNNTGKLEIWDTAKMKMIRDDMEYHNDRIGCISWSSNNLIVTGSRDKSIILRDLRVQGTQSTICKFLGHKQEVCGLKWSPNDKQIASGGNDNKLYIWSIHKPSYEAKFSEHTAAVKALAWSPHQNGLLLSGGGNNDKTIKFWNTLTYKCIKSKYTGSQVCNLLFSKNSNEFVSTHGFSNNQIIIWKYPELNKVTILEGHATRVLYLTISPNGETIVTGAGDETLRFWTAFPSINSNLISPLLPSSLDLR